MNQAPLNQDSAEIESFSQLSGQWWVPDGPFKALHDMNIPRLSFIKNQAADLLPAQKNLRILDVGCGGGILCEPLARLGHEVTGLDASSEGILSAKAHAMSMELVIDYVQEDISVFKASVICFMDFESFLVFAK